MHIVNTRERIEQTIRTGYNFEFEKYFSEGWGTFKKAGGLFVGYTILYFAISIGLNFIPILGTIMNVIISGALSAGFFVAARKVNTDGSLELGDFFKSFDFLLQLLILAFVSGLITAVLTIFLVLPGIWFAVASSLASMLVVFVGTDYWEGIKLSVQIVNKKWFHWLALFILIGLFNLLGVIALGVGLLITIPTSFCILYAAFRNTTGIDEGAQEMDTAAHLVDF
jgi:hypothetical protein